MKEASKTSGPEISGDSRSATFSPASAAGARRCSGPGFLQLDLFGQDPVHAKPFPPQAGKRASTITATSGPRSSISSVSATLNLSLANKLKTLSSSVGSTVYMQTWRERVTSAGLRLWAHTARVRTTSASDCIGYSTPRVAEAEHSGRTMNINHKGQIGLTEVSSMAGFGTPRVTMNGGTPCPEHTGKGSRLEDQAALLGYTTPSVGDYKDSPGMSTKGTNPDGSERNRLDQLPRQCFLATSGPTQSPTGSKTTSSVALNPAFSRWLMSFGEKWDVAAILAHRILKKSPRNTST